MIQWRSLHQDRKFSREIPNLSWYLLVVLLAFYYQFNFVNEASSIVILWASILVSRRGELRKHFKGIFEHNILMNSIVWWSFFSQIIPTQKIYIGKKMVNDLTTKLLLDWNYGIVYCSNSLVVMLLDLWYWCAGLIGSKSLLCYYANSALLLITQYFFLSFLLSPFFDFWSCIG